MKFQYVLRLLFISVLVFAFGCAKKAKEEIDYGRFDGSTYSHDYFGFKIELPDDWVVQGREANEALMKSGSELLAGEDANTKRALERAIEQNTINLFSAFQYEIGAPVPFNSSVLCIGEKLAQFPGVKTGADYLFHVKSFLSGSQMQVEFPSEVYSENLGGEVFYVLDIDMKMAGLTVKQKYFARVSDGYCLCFAISYGDEQQYDLIRNILSTLSFPSA